jgi:hypothetical protein
MFVVLTPARNACQWTTAFLWQLFFSSGCPGQAAGDVAFQGLNFQGFTLAIVD